MFTKIEKCRICGNSNLVRVLDLGEQMLTGVFPKEKGALLTSGPLHLVKCHGASDEVCGLLQLEHSYDLGEMYGENYGYRSGLNLSMVSHLHSKVKKILSQVVLTESDLIIDIGSNDSTTLQAYPSKGYNLVGVDPTGKKFQKFYPEHIQLIPDFFTSELIKLKFPNKKAKVITSFSMFYDLEDPLDFMKQVYDVLDDSGVWVFEQSYMPAMLNMNSYDTVCHEHIEFYALKQIKWMTDKVGFKIIDVELNGVNGGSISVTVSKSIGDRSLINSVAKIIDEEKRMNLDSLEPYFLFAERALNTKRDLLNFLKKAQKDGKLVAALGASTKGNVLLQYCGLTDLDISFIGEVNSDKFGCYTPGTLIPIISETDLIFKKPDYLIILPWHFRSSFVGNKKFQQSKLVFPLPNLEIIE